mmetsp:Transcript_25847/g.65174  ORF Transcript_25847/g.65174 Transcript_25847/m.65174 type:complete len:81 (-) Transcript_25847:32-274(-)
MWPMLAACILLEGPCIYMTHSDSTGQMGLHSIPLKVVVPLHRYYFRIRGCTAKPPHESARKASPTTLLYSTCVLCGNSFV